MGGGNAMESVYGRNGVTHKPAEDSPARGTFFCIGEGFENKLLKEIAYADNLEKYVSSLVSRRYSAATVKRMLTYVLLGVKGKEMDELSSLSPSYGRLLATTKTGREFIRNFESNEFKIITNINKIDSASDIEVHKLLQMDVRAADMYNLLCGRDIYDSSDKVMRPFIS